jgi:ABC-type transport system involved in cytochrome c biogenesis ATPase subunit
MSLSKLRSATIFFNRVFSRSSSFSLFASHGEQLLAAADATEVSKLRNELRELEARKALSSRIDEFLAWRKRLQEATAIDTARTALATNKITSQQRHLSEALLGDALTKALDEELKRLHCDRLPISVGMHTEKAETSVELRLIAHHPADLSDIVSEGERRAVALAFFLAELRVMSGESGIIVDDPVSSLDDDRRQFISDRLVEEAQRRQVIVFTHDLPCVADLQAQAESAGVPLEVRGMWRLGNDVGRIDEQPPFKTMKLKARIGQLKNRVQEWDSQAAPTNQDEAWHRINQFYADVRTTWERAVEERLFKGVVQRFQRAVKTQSLREVVITPELVNQIDEGMTRASMFVHDEPMSGGLSLPGRADLAADVELLVKFEQEVAAR